MAIEGTVTVNAYDALAEEYNAKEAARDAAEAEFRAVRQIVIGLVKADGAYPPRATKTRVLAGDIWELRLTEPTEISVDSKIALRIWNACCRVRMPSLWGNLFRKVEMFVLVGGSEKVIREKLPEGAPRNLRSLYARAVQVKDLPPSVEVKKRKQQAEAA